MPSAGARSRKSTFGRRTKSSLKGGVGRRRLSRRAPGWGQKVGISDPALLKELEALGFTPDTVVLLPLVPLVQVAWAEGGVSTAERQLIVKLARSRGIEEGGAADRQLEAWLDSQPGDHLFENATRLVRAMLASSDRRDMTADELVKHCEAIAAASGGLFGINRVSGEEHQLLALLAEQLKAR